MKFTVWIKKFSKFELILWLSSLVIITLSFFLVKSTDYLTLAASLIGATSLIFTAKGNVIGQILIVVFAILYSIISYTFRYYGEMITYLGMTGLIAIITIFMWLRNPFEGDKSQVKVNKLSVKEYIFMFILTAFVTAAFYFVLRALNTSNLVISTVSVTTSFLASYLTMRRSEYYAFAYACNDVVLIIMWIMATVANITYISMVICFVVFLVNDIYGFINWSKMKNKQHKKLLFALMQNIPHNETMSISETEE